MNQGAEKIHACTNLAFKASRVEFLSYNMKNCEQVGIFSKNELNYINELKINDKSGSYLSRWT